MIAHFLSSPEVLNAWRFYLHATVRFDIVVLINIAKFALTLFLVSADCRLNLICSTRFLGTFYYWIHFGHIKYQ
jgi:hypothetical protein